jgi:hypothetical protein
VSIVGRVAVITMSIEEEWFVVPLDSGKGPSNPKK